MIPGNHDCEIESEEQRDVLTAPLKSGKEGNKDELLKAQAAFWKQFPMAVSPTTNSQMSFLEVAASNSQRFYRVVVLPQSCRFGGISDCPRKS